MVNEMTDTAPVPPATGTLKRKRSMPRPVAIVDDNDDDRTLLRREMAFLLGDTPILTFVSGTELVRYLDTHRKSADRPHTIFLDLHMGGMDGLMTLECLHGRLSMADIAIIMVSGTQDREHVRAALENGAQAFLPKPVSRWDMLRVLQGKCPQDYGFNNT